MLPLLQIKFNFYDNFIIQCIYHSNFEIMASYLVYSLQYVHLKTHRIQDCYYKHIIHKAKSLILL
jgi:hypothetical protein